jgi:hypothetical protein
VSFDLLADFIGASPIFAMTRNYSDTTNIGLVPSPKHQTSRGFFALFEKIYDCRIPIRHFFS